MDIYSHEIASYRKEIDTLLAEYDIGYKDGNLTHFSMALSNRTNLLVIGLCSLMEAYLFDIAKQCESEVSFKIDEQRGHGLDRLKSFLTRAKGVDFGSLKSWGDFNHIYKIRNGLVHGYGGLVDSINVKAVETALRTLKCKNNLMGGRRIRLTPNDLSRFCDIVESTIEQFNERT